MLAVMRLGTLRQPHVSASVLTYVALAILPSVALVIIGRWWAVLALPLALVGPWGIVASGALLRLAFIGTGFSDPMVAVEGARERVLDGLSPYGVGYPDTWPPGAPFPYGPLMLFDSIPLEIVASIALLALLAWHRRPLTLAVVAGLPFAISLTSSGNNDYLPTFLLAAGLLVLPRWWGGALIGLSVAVKPYTAAFLPMAFANGSVNTLAVALAVAGVGWLPALWWGGFPESIAILNARSPGGSSALRFLAVPLVIAALRYGAPMACAAYAALMLTGGWISLGYLIPLIVAGGIAVEPWLRLFGHPAPPSTGPFGGDPAYPRS